MSGDKQDVHGATNDLDSGISKAVVVKDTENMAQVGTEKTNEAGKATGTEVVRKDSEVKTEKPKKEKPKKGSRAEGRAKKDYRMLMGVVAIAVSIISLCFLAFQGKFNDDYFKFPQSTEVNVGVKYMNGYAYLNKLDVMRFIEGGQLSDEALEEKYSEQFKDNVTVVDGVDCVDLNRAYGVTGKIFFIKNEGGNDKVLVQEYLGDSLSASEMDEFIAQCKASKLNLAESIFYLGVVKNINIGSGTFLDSIIILGDNITGDGGLSNYSELYASLVYLHEVSIQLKEQQDNDIYSSTYNLYVDAVNEFNSEYVKSLQESKNLPQEIKELLSDGTASGGERLTYEETLQYLWDNRESTDGAYTNIKPAPELEKMVKALSIIALTNDLRVDNEHMPSIVEIKEFEVALDLFNKSLEADPKIQIYWDRFDATEQGLLIDMPEKPKIANTVEYLGSSASIEFPAMTHLESVECLKVTSTDMAGEEVQSTNDSYYISLDDANGYFQTEFTTEDTERPVYEENGKAYISLDSACELWGYTFFIGDDSLLYIQDSTVAYTPERLEELIELFTGQPLPLALFYIGMDGNLPAENSQEFLDFVSRLATFTYTEGYEELVSSMIDYTMCNVYADTYRYNLEGKDYQVEQQNNLKRYYHELYKGLLSDKVLPYLPQYAVEMLLCKDVVIDSSLSDKEVIEEIREKVFASDYDGLAQVKVTEATKTLLQSILYTHQSRSKIDQYPTITFPKNEESSKSILGLILFYDTFTSVEGFAEMW